MRDKYEIYLSCAHTIRVICHVRLSVYNRFRQRRLLGLLRFRPKKYKSFTLCFKASLFLFYGFVIIVLQLHFCYFCGIFVDRKYTFDLRFVVCFNSYLHG